MVTCGMSKHIKNRRPVPSPHHPPTHPPNVQQWKAFTYEEEFLRETFQEGWDFARRTFCEKGILRERNFERRTFFEKGIFRERDFERRIRLIDSPNPWIKIDRFASQAIDRIAPRKRLFTSPRAIEYHGTYVRVRAQISRICKFGRVLRYVHCTDRYKIYLLKKLNAL